MKLSGKVAVVTGAAQGLGRGFTEAMLQQGAKVALLDIKVLDGRKTTKELASQHGQDKVLFLPCDVTDKGQMESAFQQVLRHFGQLDVVVNNAGVSEHDNWEMVLDVNLRSVIHGTLLGLDHMSREKGGAGGLIINIASMAGLLPMFHGPVYAATKHGVVGLSRSYGTPFHFALTGVRVCAMCPTMADTPIQPPRVASTPEEQLKADAHWAYVDNQGGLLQVSEVVDGFLQLVADDSKNGAVMRITKQKGVDYQPYGGGGQGVPYASRNTRSKL
ncbi:15-hydroxyprostaglandin dehydrogenase [NAD(+)]-like [Branchiostoma lanceolatum]|uniref:15-hydroxyprostaglandin dehydrogenase [NAD(+)]-like n=1 Tax=Branchiostoma lanceolatum TaxID=7740 RepID=UPI003451C633